MQIDSGKSGSGLKRGYGSVELEFDTFIEMMRHFQRNIGTFSKIPVDACINCFLSNS